MSWWTRSVLPKIRSLGIKRESTENLWQKCTSCGALLYNNDLEEQQYVCGNCGHHLRLAPQQRFAGLFDDGGWRKLDLPAFSEDPLRWRDTRRYVDRIRDARNNTGEPEAMVVAEGRIGGRTCIVAVQNFAFMAGSMGRAVGQALLTAADRAVAIRAPLIVFPAAGGARMQESILSLIQMPRTVLAVQQVREAGLPYLVVLTDPTTGGVTASFAMLGDVNIAEPGALIGFAGARVIQQTIREDLPEGFQRAEFLLDHGMVDMVVHRHALKERLALLLDHLCQPERPAEDAAAPAKAGKAPAPKGKAAAGPGKKEKAGLQTVEADEAMTVVGLAGERKQPADAELDIPALPAEGGAAPAGADAAAGAKKAAPKDGPAEGGPPEGGEAPKANGGRAAGKEDRKG
ncbi:acetyl-CoA carboxylase, carboxyltransferase subunit beta [Marinibaculum pumilum]|uniref:Acetyl-coenzyme A carboxylase carboxyl transferase subunit beta n=1 Tax=Marinibaculum pumilum TaxID=1766165 RepID=A0ABV7L0D6_9PROT